MFDVAPLVCSSWLSGCWFGCLAAEEKQNSARQQTQQKARKKYCASFFLLGLGVNLCLSFSKIQQQHYNNNPSWHPQTQHLFYYITDILIYIQNIQIFWQSHNYKSTIMSLLSGCDPFDFNLFLQNEVVLQEDGFRNQEHHSRFVDTSKQPSEINKNDDEVVFQIKFKHVYRFYLGTIATTNAEIGAYVR